MFNYIIGFSLRNRVFVMAFSVILVIYGAVVLQGLPVDVFPDLNRPTVTIFSEAEGLAPEEVETLVTLPIETMMNGSTGVERVRSASGIGLSLIWVEFDWGMDVYTARQIVTEKLQQATEILPGGVAPVMGPISSIMGEIMLLGLTSENEEVDTVELRAIADWEIRQRLLAIPGVSQITVIGGDVKQFQVLLDPDKLIYHDVSLHDVREALKNANVNSTGGFVFEPYQEHLIRNLGRVRNVDDIANSVLPKEVEVGVPALTINEIAKVKIGGPLGKRGDAGINGKPGVILSIQKQPNADTVKLTEAIEAELMRIEHTLPEGVKIHGDIFRQSKFIERSIENVMEALRDGSILVAIILFAFLLNGRTTFITLTAIPLSLIITAIVFKFFGMSINTMTLGGLAVAIGQLVDDAIVGVENMYRRLRENRQSDSPHNSALVVRDASVEVVGPIVFATVVVILVFVPLLAMGGIEGKIFLPLGIAYIVSILASLLVSVTVTPVLCSYLLPNMKSMEEEKDSFVVRGLKAVERVALNLAFKFKYALLISVTLAVIVTIGVGTQFGKEFLPEFNEGSVTINTLLAPGTSLAESNRIGALAETLILDIPEVSLTGRRTGRAELDDHAQGIHASEIEVELADMGRDREEVLSDIRARLDGIPGLVTNIGQPISHRIDHMLSGVRAQIAVKIFGSDLGELRRLAVEVRDVMGGVNGIVDLQIEKQVLIPQVHVVLDRDKARKHGVMVGEVAELAELALQGEVVGQVIDGQRIHDLVVRLNDEARENTGAIAAIPIDTVRGTTIPLGLVADIEKAQGPNIINRENVSRRIVIQANVSERDLVSAVDEMRLAIEENIELPEGYFITYGGQFEAQESASKLIALLGIVSLAGMFLVLFSHFKNANLALQVMLAIPLSFIGAVIGISMTGGIFSIATMVGFITLTGIAARNGILMISHYLHLMQHEGEKFDMHMIYRGTQERLVPVLMTALAATLALTPIVLAADEPGKEILHPVAVVIFSGMFTATTLNLIVTPVVFWMFGRKPVMALVPEALSTPTQTLTEEKE